MRHRLVDLVSFLVSIFPTPSFVLFSSLAILLVNSHILNRCDRFAFFFAAAFLYVSAQRYVLPVPVIPVVQYIFSLNLLKWQNKKIDSHYDFKRFEVQFTIARLRCVSVAGLAAGAIASLVGVGGGMVIGPLLLQLKIIPAESSATSGFMMVFTALSGTIQ